MHNASTPPFEFTRPPTPPADADPDRPHCQVSLIAQLGAGHRSRVQAHLRELTLQDRYLRFAHVISDDAIGAYVRQIRYGRDAAFGAFDDAGELHGFAHLAFTSGGDPAELGLSVSRCARRQGVGLALLQRAAAHARNRGERLLMMVYVPENTALESLARRAGMHVAPDPAEARAYLALPPATPESLLREAFGESVAAIDLGFRLGAAAGSRRPE